MDIHWLKQDQALRMPFVNLTMQQKVVVHHSYAKFVLLAFFIGKQKKNQMPWYNHHFLFIPQTAARTLSFFTPVQGSLEKLSVSEISMSSPYKTSVRSFLTCQKLRKRQTSELRLSEEEADGLYSSL